MADKNWHIVVDDPKGEYWEGALVTDGEATLLRHRKVVTLPIEPDLLKLSAVGGYFRRCWGSGVPFDTVAARMVCPMVLYVVRATTDHPAGLHNVHFAARLVPDSRQTLEQIRTGKLTLSGSVRLAADGSQVGAHSGGFAAGPTSVVEAKSFGQPDAEDGWTVIGSGKVNAPSEAMMAFGLYGTIPGTRIVWSAISQSR